MCPVASDLVPLLERASVSLRALWLRTLPPCREGFGAVRRFTIPCEMWVSIIKKKLVGLLIQLNLRVFKSHTHVSKTFDIIAIMSLQDVWSGYVFNVCKTYIHAGTMWL
jgi:hypothetical protein